MPTVLFINGYRFYFYMNEHPPVHIHVSKGDAKAKFILVPEIELVYNTGFKVKEMREVMVILIDNFEFIVQKWYETFDK